MTEDIHTPRCRNCDALFPTARWELGYETCMPCGEAESKHITRTIVPMHKSNYFLCTNLEDLKGINNKGGQYR